MSYDFRDTEMCWPQYSLYVYTQNYVFFNEYEKL